MKNNNDNLNIKQYLVTNELILFVTAINLDVVLVFAMTVTATKFGLNFDVEIQLLNNEKIITL